MSDASSEQLPSLPTLFEGVSIVLKDSIGREGDLIGVDAITVDFKLKHVIVQFNNRWETLHQFENLNEVLLRAE